MNDTTKPAGSIFDEMRRSIEMTPDESRAQAQKYEAEFQTRMMWLRIAEFRQKSNWPSKHASRESLNEVGEWADMLKKITSAIGTGFLTTLAGGRGNGKTQLGVELIRYVTGLEKSARFCSAMEFFMAIKATYKRDCEKTEMDVIKEFRKPSLLVIDEIGRRGETDWENNLLFELLNGRYNDKKDTLLLCNLSASELQSSLGPSLISRLNESGGLIQCNWPSFR